MAVAVICEFNPFHNGHAYLLREARRLTGSPVVCVMSGSFTQRGEAAITDKFTRAAIALKNGADLVAELPAVYAVANAQRFAEGGVAVAALLPSVTHLAFGCETDDLELLQTAADAAADENVNARIAEQMKSGESYPRAFSAAVREVYGEKTAALLASPNNILAVEYLRALRGTGIKPLPVKRVGAAHDSAETVRQFASGSFLRAALQRGEDAAAYMPELPERIADPSLLDRVILSRLRLCSPDDLRRLPDVGEAWRTGSYPPPRPRNAWMNWSARQLHRAIPGRASGGSSPASCSTSRRSCKAAGSPICGRSVFRTRARRFCAAAPARSSPLRQNPCAEKVRSCRICAGISSRRTWRRLLMSRRCVPV